MSIELEKIVTRLEKVASRLENLPQLSESGDMKKISNTTKDNLIITDYNQLLNVQLKSFLKLSDQIGGDVKTQGALIQAAFGAQLDFLNKVVTSTKPTDTVLQTMLKPISSAIENITKFRDTNRRSEYFNHLSAVSEGIPVLGWVGVSPAPCPFIKEMQDASQFYTNRVIKDFKDKNAVHVEWTKAWMTVFVELQAFVKKHYTTGLTWSAQGAAPTMTKCVPPPPPPALPPKPSTESNSDSHAALFSEINKGAGVTSGLKKVTDDMKTHKNPNLRAGSKVPAKDEQPICAKPFQGTIQNNLPEMKLEGNKWTVHYYNNNKDLVITDTAIRQTLYIFKCENCVITVKGKINSIVMDQVTMWDGKLFHV